MTRARRGGALALWLALTGAAACAKVTPPEPTPPVASPRAPEVPGPQALTIAARLDVGRETPAVDVRVAVPRSLAPAGTRALELEFLREPFAGTDAGFEQFVTRVDDDGERPWSSALPLPPGEGAIELRYRVALRHQAAGPVHGRDAVPRPSAGGWQLIGRALIPALRVDGAPVDPPATLELSLPEGWARADSLPAGAEPVSLSALRDAVYYVGEFRRERLARGAVEIEIVSSDMPDAAVSELRLLVERTLTAGESLLGALPPGRRLLVYDRVPQGFEGGVLGDAITVLSSTPDLARATGPEGAIVVHELAHLWSGGSEPWFGEGFTRYFEALLQATLDGEEDVEATRRLVRRHEAYMRGIGERSLATLDDDLAYDGGASAAYCLDTELRARGAGEDVAARFRDARARARQEGRSRPSRDDFLAALAPEPRAYLESLVRVAGPIELGPCLARAGYRVERVGYRGYTPRALALELLKVTSYSMQRAEIFKTLEGSAFRAGDIIREVDGAPVDSVPAIEPLLARARRRVAVTLLRDGALQTVELPIPRVSPKERARHERLTIAELDASHAASPFSTAPSASAPE